jgi:arylsulfatase A-like enzyme
MKVRRLFVVVAFVLFLSPRLYAAEGDKPNIVLILADDLGYGDVHCLNKDGKIATPELDKLAAEGMIFTDMHSGSAVCSPTRYGLMTGRYAWRSKLKSGVLGGLSPRLIEPGRPTLASLLKAHGYHTACIGKWHLGMDWVKLPGKSVSELNIETPEQVNNVDYTQPIAIGPRSVGFDYYFGISGSLDMVPYAFIENDRVTANPSEQQAFPLMIGHAENLSRRGPAAPGFDVADVLPTLTSRAVQYIDERSRDASGSRFFLYLPLASPHTPIAPTKEWQGKSGLNAYADFVMQTDRSIGQVLDALDERGLTDKTLVFVTSDNGCSPQARFDELAAKGHNPSYVFRGTKADIYEGGHRVPFIARWPGHVKPGASSDQMLCLTDVFATCRDILGSEMTENIAEDSVSFAPALFGTAKEPLREAIVHHSIDGSFAIRQGRWKLILCPGSGGWSKPRPADDTSGLPPVQLYDLKSDIGEKHNVQARNPAIVASLTALLEQYERKGRSASRKTSE